MNIYSKLLAWPAVNGRWSYNKSPKGYAIVKNNVRGVWQLEVYRYGPDKNRLLFTFTDGSMHTFVIYALLHFKEDYPELCYILECNGCNLGAALAKSVGASIFGEMPEVELQEWEVRIANSLLHKFTPYYTWVFIVGWYSF